MKSLPSIPSTGIGKVEGTTESSVSKPQWALLGIRDVFNVPKEETRPSVTPMISIVFSWSIIDVSLIDDTLIIEMSAWESTRKVVWWLQEMHCRYT